MDCRTCQEKFTQKLCTYSVTILPHSLSPLVDSEPIASSKTSSTTVAVRLSIPIRVILRDPGRKPSKLRGGFPWHGSSLHVIWHGDTSHSAHATTNNTRHRSGCRFRSCNHSPRLPDRPLHPADLPLWPCVSWEFDPTTAEARSCLQGS